MPTISLPGENMAVVVEVPDEQMARLAKRLIGRRTGVSVAIVDEPGGAQLPRKSDSHSLRRILVRSEAPDSAAGTLDLLHDGVWAVVPAEDAEVRRLLREAVDVVRSGLCPLLSGMARDRDEVGVFLAALKKLDSSRRARVRSIADNPLSERESQILEYIAQGVTSREIANEMGFQLQTVKNRVTTILMKTHARSRSHAVSIATVRGWI